MQLRLGIDIACRAAHQASLADERREFACWRKGERYVLRDVDGRGVDPLEARAIIAARYTVTSEVRSRQVRVVRSPGTGRRRQGSRSPIGRPFAHHATTVRA